ncbi:MAG: hypothetical protein ACI8QS_002262 [Planctomycetota bacterium]|jgi:hypothetical protein
MNLAPALLLSSLFASAQPALLHPHTAAVDGELQPTEVGQLAPPLQTVYWYDFGTSKSEPVLTDYRGDVALVHTWGYYCDSCVRTGVPLLVDVLLANPEANLRALSITVAVEDGEPDDHFVDIGREMGLPHAMGVANFSGDMTPYLDLNRNASLTWCHIIGREGILRWSGDPSRDPEEFLAATRLALQQPWIKLPDTLAVELSDCLPLIAEGRYGKARKVAAKLQQRYANKSEGIAAGASAIMAAIDGVHAKLLKQLEDSHAALEAEAFARAAGELGLYFPKADSAKRLQELLKLAKKTEGFAEDIEAWQAWFELRDERPLTFPQRKDKDAKRYAKALTKFLSKADEGAPGLTQVRLWVNAYEAE